MGWTSAFDLLGIHERGGGSGIARGRGGGGGGGGRGSNLQGWAKKDMSGNSSLAQHNRDIWKQQAADKSRDAYRHDVRKDITDKIQAENGNRPLSYKEKDARDRAVESEMKKYDADPKKQNEAFDKYRPDLHSVDNANRQRNADKSRQAAGVDPEKKQAAKEAVREEVKSQTEGAANDNDNFANDADGFGKDDFIKDRKDDAEVQNESKPKTKDIESALGNEADADNSNNEYMTRSEIEDLIDAKIADRVWYGPIS
ncbi:MAG: hypothetical protein JW713_05860 [Pontiellaceae bacterium]|nr:hypothetical protein [Pontiellaceae bacterium]